jgi:hypothetical protein
MTIALAMDEDRDTFWSSMRERMVLYGFTLLHYRRDISDTNNRIARNIIIKKAFGFGYGL